MESDNSIEYVGKAVYATHDSLEADPDEVINAPEAPVENINPSSMGMDGLGGLLGAFAGLGGMGGMGNIPPMDGIPTEPTVITDPDVPTEPDIPTEPIGEVVEVPKESNKEE